MILLKNKKMWKKILINLALNYGSKSEIINSIKLMKKNKTYLTVKTFEKNLYTKGSPDPDILIRTGGKKD